MLLAVAGTHEHPNYGSVQASADDDEEAKKEKAEKGMRLAYAMFLGLLVDGIPESILLGILAALACAGLLYFAGEAAASGNMPFHIAMVIAVVEGIAGGAMIACIAAVMLPEAFGRKHETNLLMDSGFLCTAGFLCAVLIKVIGGYVSSDHLEEASKKDAHEHA